MTKGRMVTYLIIRESDGQIRRVPLARLLSSLLLVLSLGAAVALAQDLTLRQMDHTAWTAREGAPIGVNDIAAASDGTLWLATRGGLYRFDGLHFTIYLPPPGQPSLPSIEMRTVYMARDQGLWLAPWLKDIIFIKDGRVRIFSQRDGLPSATVAQMLQAPDGAMWALIGNKLYRLHDDRWSEAIPNQKQLGEVTSFFFDRAGVLWIATRSYLYFVPKGKAVPVKTTENCGSVSMFAETSDGSLWIDVLQPHGAIRRVSVPGHSADKPLSFSVEAIAMTTDSAGNIWVGSSREGVIRLSASAISSDKSGTIPRRGEAMQSFDQKLGLSGIGVFDVFRDATGTVWAGTTRGLDRFRGPSLTRLPDPNAEGDVGVTACPDGTVWVGSGDFLLSTDGVKIRHHKMGEVWGVYCDAKSNLWFNREGKIAEWKHGKERSFPSPVPSRPYCVAQIAGDERQLFAVCAQSGLWRRADGHWGKVELPGFPSEAPVAIAQDRSGRLWTGYIDNKVGLLDGDIGKTYPVDTAPGIGNVQAILAGQHSVFAAGAHGFAALQGDHFASLLTADEDAVQGVSGLVEDHDGDLWLNGARGVFRIQQQEVNRALATSGYRMRSQRFSGDGLAGFPYQTYELPSAVISPNGRIWLATSSTAVYIDPDSVHRDTVPPITSIQGFLDNDRPRNEAEPQINPGKHTLRIRYFGAHLSAPERVSYRYLLEGQDQGWQEVGTRTEAVYTNLKPGGYTFRVAANNGDGVWSEAQEPLRFQVIPAFYQRWWFLTLCLIVLVLLSGMLFRLRLQYATAQMRRRLEERAQERMRIARDLHDTLLQGIQGLVLCFHSDIEEVPEDQPARGMLEKTLTRAEEVIAEGRERVRTLRSEESTATDLPEALAQVSSVVRSNTAAPIEFLVQGEPRPLRTVVHDEVYCIGREAITNALRHARASRIEIEINYAPTHLRLRCHDNGKGMSREQLETGSPAGHWGVTGMRERASRIGARLDIWSTPGAGTEVDLSVPAATAYLGDSRKRGWAWLGHWLTEPGD
jgi:signal transduction histidine kinase/ligand-binding sensor domain-containing protein